MTLQTRVESRCLAKIEALDTTIVGQGENQLRLGVIYLQIGWQTSERMMLHTEGEKQVWVYWRSKCWTQWSTTRVKINYVWVSFISKLNQKENERITMQNEGEKQVSMSAECQNVGHDDYYNRRRINYNDDQKTKLLVGWIDLVRCRLRFRQQ